MKQNKPSATAMFVNNGMYYNIQHKSLDTDIPADIKNFCIQLVEYHYGNSWLNKQFLLAKASLFQLFSVPGFYLHFLLRKKCIERHVVNFLDRGFEQVIVLGAGYDTLCSRLALKYKQVHFIELDHPATTGHKTSLFSNLGWNRSNIAYIAHDLTTVDNPYTENRVNTSLKTVFVCEGVLMYLHQHHVEHILNTLKTEFTNECGLVFTFMEELEEGNYMFKNARGFVKWWLQIKNEPFTWGVRPGEMRNFLSKNGWSLIDLYDHKKLKAEFLSPQNIYHSIAMGEDVVMSIKN